MKIMFCGDIVGRAGRDAVVKEVPGCGANSGSISSS